MKKQMNQLRLFILNSKGGCGKSTAAMYAFLVASMQKKPTHFLDLDNTSVTLTNFFNNIKDRKPEFIKSSSFSLLGKDNRIDRSKIDSFIEAISTLDYVIADFGAESSNQFCQFLKEEAKNGIVQTLNGLNVRILLVFAGGGCAVDCLRFFELLKSVEGVKEITHIVANEYHGGFENKTVTDFTKATITLAPLTDDPLSEANIQFTQMLQKGVVYDEILKLSVMRKTRIIKHLENFANQLENTIL